MSINRQKSYLSFVVVLLLLVNMPNAYAEWTYVYCAKSDQSDWYWLKDISNHYATISGNWGMEKLRESRKWGAKLCYEYFFYFSVSDDEYSLISEQCREGYVPQPANNKYSQWYIFNVNKSNGEHYFAPGYYTILEGGLECFDQNLEGFESHSPWQ
ncbi:hypothetical protein [Spartinivicinus ruber]|uniref:hypothetical protein n=1 Tax=Spartinivicinus ruber TaxID=2683272 RepID=UPI0013D2BD41|nr:hypothetical protein [Spartinivicinus ruber]